MLHRCKFLVAAALALMALTPASAIFADAPNTAPDPLVFLEVTIPIYVGLNPAYRPPIATYEWATAPGSPDPAEFRWIMVSVDDFGGIYVAAEDYIRNTPDAPEWSAWQAYTAPGGSWTSPPLGLGPYCFAVQGRDGDGNAEDLDTTRNMRRVQVTTRSTGPILTVTGTLIDPIITSTVYTPLVTVDVSAGTTAEFCWTADASHYGGIVTGYRYGWDILDPDDEDDPGWDIGWTPFVMMEECSFPRAFFFGTHTFTIQVIDNDGYMSRVSVVLNVAQTTPVEPATWGFLKSAYRKR